MKYSKEKLIQDDINGKLFREYFENRNKETADLFIGRTQYKALNMSFILRIGSMPKISLLYLSKAKIPEYLREEIFVQYNQLFGEQAITATDEDL